MKLFNSSDNLNEILEGRLVLINKPIGWTSFQVVNKVRHKLTKAINIKKLKVGHSGTLDPLATGLLIIAIGKATKQISELQNMSKVYIGTFCFGSTTPSYDLETSPDKHFSFEHLNAKIIIEKTIGFTGKINQKPPIFSAIKKKGKRLYEYARNEEFIDLETRKVEIKRFEIKSIHLPNVDFEVKCSKGTYIRSLAHDFAMALDSGAHLSFLKRISIGDYKIKNALEIDDFEKLI